MVGAIVFLFLTSLELDDVGAEDAAMNADGIALWRREKKGYAREEKMVEMVSICGGGNVPF